MNSRELLTAHLPDIQQAIRFVCRTNRLDAQEHEDFASLVIVKLMENDCGVISKFEGRSSFSTFVTAVVQRLLLDYRVHLWGKWHPSNEAQRAGEAAVLLERLLHRDDHPFEEAAAVVLSRHPNLTRPALEELFVQLPRRAPRPRAVELTEGSTVAVTAGDHAEQSALETEQRRTSDRVSGIVSAAIGALPEEDRTILRLRFACDMSMAQIARSLHIHEKKIQRRFQKQLESLRQELERNGLSAAEILALIGANGSIFDFSMSDPGSRPSMNDKAVQGTQGLRR